MSQHIVIIGSGFAARQLVKQIRKQDSAVALTLIAADSIDEYNKPDLSHVISQLQQADDLTRQRAADFAEQYQVAIHPHTTVTAIEPATRTVRSADRAWQYDKLVLATGASAGKPPIEGQELMLTLNSQQEYQQCQAQLQRAARVLILGAGLIGTELAMDFARAGKQVVLADMQSGLLPGLLPSMLSGPLQASLADVGVRMLFNARVQMLSQTADGIVARFADQQIETDAVVAATGLRPNIALAQQAGLVTQRGIVVDACLQTSDPAVYALGDCAEIVGQVMPYLQPIQLSALALAKTLLGTATPLTLPAMLVKVKTPLLPLQLAGETARPDLYWQISREADGLVARGCDDQGALRAFVVSEEKLKEAFALLRQLPAHCF